MKMIGTLTFVFFSLFGGVAYAGESDCEDLPDQVAIAVAKGAPFDADEKRTYVLVCIAAYVGKKTAAVVASTLVVGEIKEDSGNQALFRLFEKMELIVKHYDVLLERLSSTLEIIDSSMKKGRKKLT